MKVSDILEMEIKGDLTGEKPAKNELGALRDKLDAVKSRVNEPSPRRRRRRQMRRGTGAADRSVNIKTAGNM